jgi:hypothetical protein
VEDEEAEQGRDGKVHHGEAKHVRAVQLQVARHGLEVDPSPHERERDRGGEHAAPHDEPVGRAAQPAAAEDEAVGGKFEERAPPEFGGVDADGARREEHLPPALPVQPRRGTLQPHRVAIADAERREECGEGIADQRRVEVIQVTRAGDDQKSEDSAGEQAPGSRPDPFARDAGHGFPNPIVSRDR